MGGRNKQRGRGGGINENGGAFRVRRHGGHYGHYGVGRAGKGVAYKKRARKERKVGDGGFAAASFRHDSQGAWGREPGRGCATSRKGKTVFPSTERICHPLDDSDNENEQERPRGAPPAKRPSDTADKINSEKRR